jgi:hypothetical protein
MAGRFGAVEELFTMAGGKLAFVEGMKEPWLVRGGPGTTALLPACMAHGSLQRAAMLALLLLCAQMEWYGPEVALDLWRHVIEPQAVGAG